MTKLFTNPRPQFFDKSGNILSYGQIIFLEAGTDIPKPIYTDASEANELDNPHQLDGSGYVNYGGVWLGRGKYKAVFQSYVGRDDDGKKIFKTEYEVDNIDGAGYLSEQSLDSIIVETVLSLRDITGIDVVYCLGYETPHDNGGGWFYFVETSTIPDDGGGFISRNSDPSIGRYIRVVNSNFIMPEQWGALPDRNDLTVSANFTNLISYAKLHGKDISINGGTYYVNGSVTFDGDIHVEINSDVFFENILLPSAIIRFECQSVKIGTTSAIVTGYKPAPHTKLQIFPRVPMEYYVDWWNIDGITPSIDHTPNIQEALDGTFPNSVIIFSSGVNYNVTNNINFSSHILKFINDSRLTLDSGSYSINKVINDNATFTCLALGSDAANIFNINYTYVITDWDVSNHEKYTRFITKTTVNGIRPAKYIWNKSRNILNDGNYGNLPDNQTHVINAPINLNTLVKMGYIESCINGGLIPNTANNSPIVTNREILPEWFRYLVTSSADIDSLVKAIHSCANSIEVSDNGQYVSAGKKEYILDGAVNIVIPTKIVKLRDIRIVSLSGNTSFTTHDSVNYTMHFDVHAMYMDNVTILKHGNVGTSAIGIKANRVETYNSKINNIDTGIGVKYIIDIKKTGLNTVTKFFNFESTDSVGSGIRIDHDSIEINSMRYKGVSPGGWFFIPNPALCKISQFYFEGSTLFTAFEVNALAGSTFTNNTFNKSLVHITGGGYLLNSSMFIGARLMQKDPQQCSVRGNSFRQIAQGLDAQVQIINTIANSQCNGLIIEDNDFYKISGATIKNVVVTGEAYGLSKVSIKNNTCLDYLVAGTELTTVQYFNVNTIFGAGAPGQVESKSITVDLSNLDFLFNVASFYRLEKVVIDAPLAGSNNVPNSTSDNRECLAFTVGQTNTAAKTANFRYTWSGTTTYLNFDVTQTMAITLSSSRI